MHEHELRSRIKSLLYSQLYGVLATQGEEEIPHASIIAFAGADDLLSIVFATPRNTRKYDNMLAHPRIAFFIDDRRASGKEIMETSGLEARGRVRELRGPERGGYRDIYVARHPDMASFADAPGSALMRLTVERYDMVEHFQHVLVLKPGSSVERTGGQS